MESFLGTSGKELDAIDRFGGKLCEFDQIPFNASRFQRGNPVNFPMKLMILLNEDPDPSAITWLPDGRSFIVKNQEKFTKDICPSKVFQFYKIRYFPKNVESVGF